MNHGNIREAHSDYLVTVPSVWVEESSSMPSTDFITATGSPIHTLLAYFFGTERNTSRSVNFMVNFHSGQVLDVANNSLKNYAPVQQNPFNGGDNQRWQLIQGMIAHNAP